MAGELPPKVLLGIGYLTGLDLECNRGERFPERNDGSAAIAMKDSVKSLRARILALTCIFWLGRLR